MGASPLCIEQPPPTATDRPRPRRPAKRIPTARRNPIPNISPMSTTPQYIIATGPPPPPMYAPEHQQNIPNVGPATHPSGPEYAQYYQPSAAELYARSQQGPPPPGSEGADGMPPGGPGVNHYPSANGVEKQQVTTSATQLASQSRRRNEAHFVCPVPGCGSTFTRRFNLRGHLRSHTEERPYVCDWPNCKKGFARQHDCKRHQALHTTKAQTNICIGCKKTFSRLDALNVMRSDGGADCRAVRDQGMQHEGMGEQQPPQMQQQ
ncbi:hypothetical protein K438DRAFT_1904012 [Mycena galopus ATCC 62051]|nr:hypothetical protein K438DRAFT_1904012 [Mycena galopus ATCC 62051]